MPTASTTRRISIPPSRKKPRDEPVIELPPLPSDLFNRLRDDIRARKTITLTHNARCAILPA